MMGTGHFYFDLVKNQLFALMKVNIYKKKPESESQQLHQCSSAEKGKVIKKSMKLWFVKTLLNMYFLKCLKS
jgi:hypothetical protein